MLLNFIERRKYKLQKKYSKYKTTKNRELHSRLLKSSSDAFSIDYCDVYRLWKYVRSHKPKFILEYGSGFSTVTMAAALQKNNLEGTPGKLLSIEGHERWKENTESLLTEEEKQFTEVKVLTPEICYKKLKIQKMGQVGWYKTRRNIPNTQGIIALEYKECVKLVPDFIFLDGPDPKSVPNYGDDQGHFPPIVIDALQMEKNLPKGSTILVDGRGSNCTILFNNLKEEWSCKKLHFSQSTVFRKK